MKKVSGSMKLDLAQYYELEAFSQFASDLDEGTKKVLRRGQSIVESMKQKQFSPYALWQEVVVIYAATGGYLDRFEVQEIQNKIEQMLAHFETSEKELINKIEKDKKLTDEIKALLKERVTKFLSKK
jgi:F0F1-type ATP synthase alpha subunit